jgi:DNA-binding beta-propeller fold protein YncE
VCRHADERSGHLFIISASPDNEPYTRPGRHLLILDGRTGRLLRSIALPSEGSTVIAGQDGLTSAYLSQDSCILDTVTERLYVFDAARHMSVIDAVHGRLLFTRRLRFAVRGAALDERTGRIFAFDASIRPAVAGSSTGGSQRLTLQTGTMVMLDAVTGRLLRTKPGGIIGSDARDIAVDQTSNRIFALNQVRKTVTVLDGASGRTVRTITLERAPLRILLDGPHHRALVDTGSITVVDARRGAIVRTISLGTEIDDLAVDPSSGHIFIATSSLRASYGDPWGWLPHWLRSRLPGIPQPPPALKPSQRILTNTVLTLDPAR